MFVVASVQYRLLQNFYNTAISLQVFAYVFFPLTVFSLSLRVLPIRSQKLLLWL